MFKVFNQTKLYIVLSIFFVFLILRVIYSYWKIENLMMDFAKEESQVLSTYAEVHRDYYQKLYLKNIIKLNQKTIIGLPAYSSSYINKNFSKDNILNIKLKTVSNITRNSSNRADKEEMKAIEFFISHPEKNEYFDTKNSDYYQYAKVLKITQRCLKCHGKVKDAPDFVKERYDNAYNFKLGDVRGIISIKISKKQLKNYFFNYFIHSTIFDIILFFAMFVLISYLINKTKKINRYLEEKIKEKTIELKKSYIYDKLTGLPNRTSLIEKLEKNKGMSNRVLIILNIDNFKDINDVYGHSFGDKVLKQIADELLNFCLQESINKCIYKLSGDEFAVLLIDNFIENKSILKMKKMIDAIQETKFKIDSNDVFIRLSCGVSYGKGNLLVEADMALKIAKNKNKSFIIYHESLNRKKDILKNINTINILKNAIKNDNIVPFYQPIYNTKTKKVEKYESLVRIISNDEVITPNNFLDIAVKSKLYSYITEAVVLKSFNTFKDGNYEFSINISIEDILNQNTKKLILNSLDNFSYPHKVVFEILENDKIKNYEELNNFIKELKRRGAKVAIDDFGSGYSNFSHVLSLNIDYIKIDASLIKNILNDEDSKKITQTIIYFAKSLEIETIAEFVENEELMIELVKMGVDYIQGYYIGEPKSF